MIFYHPTQIYHLQVFHPHGIVGQVNVTFHRIEHQVGNVLPFCFPFPFAFAFVLALALSASAPPFTFRLHFMTFGHSLAIGHGHRILLLEGHLYRLTFTYTYIIHVIHRFDADIVNISAGMMLVNHSARSTFNAITKVIPFAMLLAVFAEES